MFIYNNTLQQFRKRIRKEIKIILKDECHIEVRKTRFLYRGYLYPIEILLFEKKDLLGFFDSKYYTIGLHKNLLLLNQSEQETIKNILRHEIGHYLCFLDFGDQHSHHGKEFKERCRSFGWGEEVYSAKLKLDFDLLTKDVDKKNAILAKVQKLLTLAESENQNESELATLKANEILQKYHLKLDQDTVKQTDDSEDEMVALTVWEGKRNSSKMMCISEILGHFFVYPYFNYGKNIVRLEIMGEEQDVKIADYLCKYYINEFESQWKKQKHLKGMKQKNSFFRGLTKGHILKLQNQSIHEPHQSRELIKMKKALIDKVHKYLPHLGGRYQDYQTDGRAESLGRSFGQEMNVRKGIGEGKGFIRLLK